MMADDMGVGDLGCYGQKFIKTPNIDRAAAQGMRFTSAYAGSAVCAPSRSCLMTGLHSGHTRVRWNHSVKTGERPPLRPEDVTVAEVLKKAGYATGITGKWGLGEPETTGVPTKKGFDSWFGFLNQDHALEYYTGHLWRNETKEPQKGTYVTDLFTDEALRFIRVNRARAFYLYFTPTTPHAPMEIPSTGEYSNAPMNEAQKKYAAMVASFDAAVGKILDTLKNLQIDQRTIVFITSDNGNGNKEREFFRGTLHYRAQKGDPYEGGHRVPMIVRWPGRVKAGVTSDFPWAFWDFLPTAAELAGAKPPANIDGISILPALLGKGEQAKRPYFYWETHSDGFHQAIRDGQWKAVRHELEGEVELYDLSIDESETRNLAAANPDITARMRRWMDEARTPNEDYPPKRPPRRRKK